MGDFRLEFRLSLLVSVDLSVEVVVVSESVLEIDLFYFNGLFKLVVFVQESGVSCSGIISGVMMAAGQSHLL